MLCALAAEIHLMPDWTVAVQLVIFFLATCILSAFVFRPVLRVLDHRRGLTDGAREEAAKMEDEARRLAEERESKMAEALADADSKRIKRVAEAGRAAQGIVQEAQREARRVLETAAASALESKRLAAAELGRQAGALAEEIASRVLPGR